MEEEVDEIIGLLNYAPQPPLHPAKSGSNKAKVSEPNLRVYLL